MNEATQKKQDWFAIVSQVRNAIEVESSDEDEESSSDDSDDSDRGPKIRKQVTI